MAIKHPANLDLEHFFLSFFPLNNKYIIFVSANSIEDSSCTSFAHNSL